MRSRVAPEERAALEHYLALLYRSGATLNLTRVRREVAWERHIEESLYLQDLTHFAEGALVADLGSGGGLPGIPLAVLRPGVRFLLLERTAKKAEFLRTAVAQLGLDNVRVLAAEARECPRRPGWEPADAVVSRAAGPPAQVAPTALALLRSGGEALLIVAGATALSRDLLSRCRIAGGTPPELVRSGAITVLRIHRQS